MKYTLFFILILLGNSFKANCQSAEELYDKASVLFDQKEYIKAIPLIENAVLKDSTNSKYLLLLGNAFYEDSQYKNAFNVFTKGINLHPYDPYFYNQRGLLLKQLGETEYAIGDFDKALTLNLPDSVRLTILVNRGASKIDIRNFHGAFDDFTEALKYDSLNIGTLNNLAAVCDEVGKGNMTLMYLYKIIEIDSTFEPAYGNIGFKHQEMGDYRTAIIYFNKVLSLKPNDPLGYSNRAYNYYKLNKYDLALSDINYSLSLYPTNSYALKTRALIYFSMKDNVKGCKDLEEALYLGYSKMYGDSVEKLIQEYCK